MNPATRSNSKTAEIVEEYISSLRDLTANSKPYINMLTQLAEDYIEYASAIVEAIEAHLHKVNIICIQIWLTEAARRAP